MAVKAYNNFTPKTEVILLQSRRSVPVADVTLIDPNNNLCIYDGEWLIEDASGKLVRASTIGSVGNAATKRAMPCWSERGRTDVMAAPEPALSVIKGGTDSIWDTNVFDAAATVGSGAPITARGQQLKVATITLSSPQGSRNFTGLVGHGGSADTHPVVAVVEELGSATKPMRIRLVGGRQLPLLPRQGPGPTMDITNSFLQKIATDEGRAKVAEYSGKFIFDRLRERSFARPILNARKIDPSECQISTKHDTLVKIEWLEPGARAMPLEFRGSPDTEFIRADRCEMGFYTIASPIFTKNEQELQVYRDMPLTKIIEDNSLKDMEELEDRGFLIHVEAAVQALQAEANGVTVAPALNSTTLQGASPPIEFSVVKGELARNATSPTAASFALQRPDVTTIKNLLTDNRLRGDTLLMTESDLNMVDTWTLEDMGDRVQSDTVVDGFKGSSLIGLKVVKSIKNDILRRGNVYLFTAPEFLGRFYILNQTKFYVDKRFQFISWMAWEDLGMLIANIGACKKMELYPGDATANNSDSIRDRFIPKPIKDLNARNNRVQEGLTFPQVTGIG